MEAAYGGRKEEPNGQAPGGETWLFVYPERHYNRTCPRLADTPPVPAGLQSILSLEVPVIVQIAERMMPLEDVIALAPGAIIELPKAADEDLEIRVNNKTIGTGKAVKVGENYGIRVSYIGDLNQRITAMGEGSDGPDLDDLGFELDGG